MKLLLKVPIINDKIKATVREGVVSAFGGRFAEVIVGGAAFYQEVEQFLHMIEFPYTVGYGMTECGPIICYEDWSRFKPGSCGKAVPRMEVKILSPDPENIPGEIVCRGHNVMLGYYKNEEANREAIDADGWLHTGDLALMDAEGNVTIKGRSKNMLLGASGQNIWLYAGSSAFNATRFSSITRSMSAVVRPCAKASSKSGYTSPTSFSFCCTMMLSAYSQIFKMKIYPEEFEKTPKRSIKRFLYQEAKG